MLNRTAGKISRNAVPLSPTLIRLEPEQRARILKSGQKVGRMLGTAPVLDIVSPGRSARTPLSTSRSVLTTSVLDGKRAPVRAMTGPSPVRPIHSVSILDGGLPSPVLHITVSSPLNERKDKPAQTKATNAGRGIRRKRVPTALPLKQAVRTEALPLSPFHYATLKTTKTPSLSPLAPLSPLSPITTQKVDDGKIEKLHTLEKLAQYSTLGVPQEMIYPSFGQMEEQTGQVSVTSFLDLYRLGSSMGLQERQVPQRSASLPIEVQSATVAPAPPLPAVIVTSPSAAVAALLVQRRGRANSRSSTGTNKRRSRSADNYYSVTDAFVLQSPPFGTRMSGQIHAASTLSPVGMSSAFLAPPDSALFPSAQRASFASTLFSPSIYSQMSPTIHSPEPVTSPVRRERSIAQARRSILTDDAQKMARFRTRFGVRPLEFALPETPMPPAGPLPSPPYSPALPIEVRSPRVPYWVRNSYRPKDGMQALALVNMCYDPEGKRRGAKDKRKGGLRTPRTQKFERRMGWGGDWNSGLVDSLKQLS